MDIYVILLATQYTYNIMSGFLVYAFTLALVFTSLQYLCI